LSKRAFPDNAFADEEESKPDNDCSICESFCRFLQDTADKAIKTDTVRVRCGMLATFKNHKFNSKHLSQRID
jgi:hypothetical protein